MVPNIFENTYHITTSLILYIHNHRNGNKSIPGMATLFGPKCI